ncbi:FK506 binding protein proline rotamase rapamycin-binding protein [Bonamia ostreae]|uniref:peptidylprolyl isomerase n=1 Tax=Bonamia ostreae TaxID=126728 RepID=A0ABV2AT58_9EUKA
MIRRLKNARSLLFNKRCFATNSNSEGLKIETLIGGDDKSYPQKGNIVDVHYEAYLENGTMFDSSRKREEPFRFEVGQGIVIPGLDKAILRLSLGQRAVLTIPSNMGYGTQSVKRVIPKNSTLIFDLELLKIEQFRAKQIIHNT